MTSPKIDTAIAQACGWKHVQGFRWENSNGLSFYEWDIPNYSKDLNAMHEAEKVLTTDQFYVYAAWIDKLVPKFECRAFLGATARQRAEAFLRTLGLWKEAAK